MVDDTVVYNSARALGEANAQLELAVDLGQIAIWRHDLRDAAACTTTIAARRCSTSRRAPRACRSAKSMRYIHPDDLPMVRRIGRARARAPTSRPTLEARYRRADGSWRYVLTRSVVAARRRRRAARLRRRRARRDRARRAPAHRRGAGAAARRGGARRRGSASGRRRRGPRRDRLECADVRALRLAEAAAPADARTSGSSTASTRRTASASRRGARGVPAHGEQAVRDRVPHACARTAAAAGS